MNKIYIAENSNKILMDYLLSKGFHIELISTKDIVDPAIACHPDVFQCKLGWHANAPRVFAKPEELGLGYPGEAAFNAACTGKYFIHNLKVTHPRLLNAAKAAGMELIHIPQGYGKCSTVIVDEQSIITYDHGIAKACSAWPDLDVLLISPGHILLHGYSTGFIGGCSGRIGDEVIFNGDLSSHPDFKAIHRFVDERNLKCVWFNQYPLTDIGSIL